MNLPGLLWLLADVGLLGIISVSVVLRYRAHFPTILDRLVAILLCAFALLIGTGLLLGLAGCLRSSWWSLLLLAGALGSFWLLKSESRGRLADFIPSGFRLGGREKGLAALLVLGLALFSALALFTEPTVNDSLAYRLPRIAHWEQNGSLWPFPTNDQRMLYMSWGPDLAMLWVVGHFRTDFPGATLVSVLGGALLMVSVMGLLRTASLTRFQALVGGSFLFLLPNVLAQFRTDQTDLFTAGMVAAGLHFSARAALRGCWSRLACFAWGLGLCCKGTVYFLLPGLALWQIALLRRRLFADRRSLLVSSFVFFLSWACFSSPLALFNFAAYGNAFGPPRMVAMHRGEPGIGAGLRRVAKNALGYAVQNMQTASQPLGLAPLLEPLAEPLVNLAPADERDMLRDPENYRSLREALGWVVRQEIPDADTLAFGVIPAVLFVIGCWRGRRHPLVLASGMGLAAFLLFYWQQIVWHPYGFRYLILGTPWLLIPCFFVFKGGSTRSRVLPVALVAILMVSAVSNLVNLLQNGLGINDQDVLLAGQKKLISQISEDAVPECAASFPQVYYMAGFFRQGVKVGHVNTEMVMTEAKLLETINSTPSWVLLPAVFYQRSFLQFRMLAVEPFPSRESVYATIAVRRLRPGETPSFKIIPK